MYNNNILKDFTYEEVCHCGEDIYSCECEANSQLSLDKQESYNKRFIGYGTGKKPVPKGAIFFSTAPNNSVKSIHYKLGINQVSITINPIDHLEFQKLSIIIYFSKNSESIVPFVQLCIGLLFLVSAIVPGWIAFINFKEESILLK